MRVLNVLWVFLFCISCSDIIPESGPSVTTTKSNNNATGTVRHPTTTTNTTGNTTPIGNQPYSFFNNTNENTTTDNSPSNFFNTNNSNGTSTTSSNNTLQQQIVGKWKLAQASVSTNLTFSSNGTYSMSTPGGPSLNGTYSVSGSSVNLSALGNHSATISGNTLTLSGSSGTKKWTKI